MKSLDTTHPLDSDHAAIIRWEDDGGAVPPNPEIAAQLRAERRARLVAMEATALGEATK